MRAFGLIVAPLVLVACLEDEEPAAAPRAFFVSPVAGARVSGDVRVQLGVTGFKLKPAGSVEENAGYLTVFVDEPCLRAGEIIHPASTRLSLTGGESVVDLALDLGPHRLCVQASDGRGVALDVTSVLEFEVIESRVRFVSPNWGDVLPLKVKFKLAAEGLEIEAAGESRPGAGHFYLVIDDECPPEAFPISLAENVVNLAQGEKEVELELTTGTHEIWLGVADGEDIALAPRTRVQIYVGPY